MRKPVCEMTEMDMGPCRSRAFPFCGVRCHQPHFTEEGLKLTEGLIFIQVHLVTKSYQVVEPKCKFRCFCFQSLGLSHNPSERAAHERRWYWYPLRKGTLPLWASVSICKVRFRYANVYNRVQLYSKSLYFLGHISEEQVRELSKSSRKCGQNWENKEGWEKRPKNPKAASTLSLGSWHHSYEIC